MIKPFVPQLVYIEPRALEYPLGRELKEKFEGMGIEIRETTSHNQVRNIPGKNDLQKYRNAKSTLVIGVRKTLKFDTSKPSAEYAIPFATGCMGHCHYCYLQTTMGSKPYIRTYVNVEEILDQAEQYMNERAPEITRFEASCTSDIVGIDHLTHTLKAAIEYFTRLILVSFALSPNFIMSIIYLMQSIMVEQDSALVSMRIMSLNISNPEHHR